MRKIISYDVRWKVDLVRRLNEMEFAIRKTHEVAYPAERRVAMYELEIAYNAILKDARQMITNVMNGIERYIRTKEEGWIFTEEGSGHGAWKDTWEDCYLEDLDMSNWVVGEPIDPEAFPHAKLLASLPEKVTMEICQI